jgi:hypothetical protein
VEQVDKLMQSYATDSDHNRKAVVVLTILAILSAWLLPRLLHALQLSVPWWLDAPAVMGFFGLYWTVYDRWAWKWRVGSLRVTAVPDLAGRWQGALRSSHNPETDTPIDITIHQTATQILVQSHTAHSESTSIMAALNCRPGLFQGLTYLYENWPQPLGLKTLEAHRGRAHLKMDGDKLVGTYMTDFNRGNEGRFEVSRVRDSAT